MLRLAPHEVLARSDLVGPAEQHRAVGSLLDELVERLPPDLAVRVGLPSAVQPVELVRADLLRRAGAALSGYELIEAARTLPGAEGGFALRPEPPDEALFRAARLGPRPRPAVSPAATYRAEEGRERLHRARLLVGGVGGTDGALPAARWVLAVAQHPGHLEDLAVIGEELARAGGGLGLLATDGRVQQAASDAGLAARVVAPGRADRIRAWRSAREVRRTVRQVLDSARLPSLEEPARAVFADAVDRSLAAHLPWLLWSASDIGREVARADVVVLHIPYIESGRLAGGLAHVAGTPVVALQHGTVFSADPRWEGLAIDRICAWGAPSATALRSSGVAPDTIMVTGALKYDRMVPVERAPHRQRGRRVVLVGSSGPGDPVSVPQHQLFVAALGEAVDQTPDVDWTVKLHPKDRPGFYRALPARVQVVTADHRATSILDHLAGSDVLVTVCSMTAVDSVAAGVPVVLFEVKGSRYARDEPFLADAASAVVASGAELAAAVRSVDRSAPAADAYLADHFAHRGEALRRTVEVIDSVRRR